MNCILSSFLNDIFDELKMIVATKVFIIFVLLCVGFTSVRIFGRGNEIEKIDEVVLHQLGIDIDFDERTQEPI